MNAQSELHRDSEHLSKYCNMNSAPMPKNIKLESSHFPLTISYMEKTYILVLTKSGKLLLQKPFEDISVLNQ